MWEFLSQNLRNKISVTDFFTRIWGIARDKHQFKIGKTGFPTGGLVVVFNSFWFWFVLCVVTRFPMSFFPSLKYGLRAIQCRTLSSRAVECARGVAVISQSCAVEYVYGTIRIWYKACLFRGGYILDVTVTTTRRPTSEV